MIYAKTAHLHISFPIFCLGVMVLGWMKNRINLKVSFFLVETKLLSVFLCAKQKVFSLHSVKFVVWQSTTKQLCAKDSGKILQQEQKLENKEAVFCFLNIAGKQKKTYYLYLFCFSNLGPVKNTDISNQKIKF